MTFIDWFGLVYLLSVAAMVGFSVRSLHAQRWVSLLDLLKYIGCTFTPLLNTTMATHFLVWDLLKLVSKWDDIIIWRKK